MAFEERWKRFDEAVQLLRCLLCPDAPPLRGHFYAWESTRLEPLPVQESGPPIWIGSWGSDAGLRRVARLRLSKHPRVVREWTGSAASVSRAGRQGAGCLSPCAGNDVLVPDR